MGFQLELLGNDDLAFKQVHRRAHDLALEIEKKAKEGPEDKVKKDFMNQLVFGLRNHESWQILQLIDGYGTEASAEAQAIADLYLSPKQIQEAFTIALNVALLIERTGPPGYNKGHSILFDAIADRLDSKFYQTITPKLKTRLNNGRFWENLPDLAGHLNNGVAYSKIEDVLMNHFNNLKITFVPRGLYIFNRNAANVKKFYLYSDEGMRLSQKAIDRYFEFIKKIDAELYSLNITPKEFVPIVKPYIEVLVTKNEEEKPVVKDSGKRLQEPVLQKYLHKDIYTSYNS